MAEIGNGVGDLPANLFSGCNHLTNIILGSGVRTIAADAFAGCDAVLRMTCRAEVPPTAPSNPFTEFSTGIPISVPCGSVDLYQNAAYWGFFTNYQGQSHSFSAVSADIQRGSVRIITAPDCTNLQAEVQANAYSGYRFTGWSDGNTDAHRYVIVTQDTALVAYFEPTTGIGGDIERGIHVSVRDAVLTVSGTTGEPLTVSDAMGRTIYSGTAATECLRITLPTVGIYFVRLGARPAVKVLAAR